MEKIKKQEEKTKKKILRMYYSMLSTFREKTKIEKIKTNQTGRKGMIIAFSDICWIECFYDPQSNQWEYEEFNPENPEGKPQIRKKMKEKELKEIIKNLYEKN